VSLNDHTFKWGLNYKFDSAHAINSTPWLPPLSAMSRHMQRSKKLLMMSQHRLFCVGRIGKHRFHRSVYNSWQPNREG